MARTYKDELFSATSTYSSILEELSIASNTLSSTISNISASSVEFAKGGGYDSIRNRLKLYSEVIQKLSQFADNLSIGITSANNDLANYMQGYNYLSDEELIELEPELKNTESLLETCKNNLKDAEEGYYVTVTKYRDDGTSYEVQEHRKDDELISKYKADIEDFKIIIDELKLHIRLINGLPAASKSAFGYIEIALDGSGGSSNIREFSSAVSNIKSVAVLQDPSIATMNYDDQLLKNHNENYDPNLDVGLKRSFTEGYDKGIEEYKNNHPDYDENNKEDRDAANEYAVDKGFEAFDDHSDYLDKADGKIGNNGTVNGTPGRLSEYDFRNNKSYRKLIYGTYENYQQGVDAYGHGITEEYADAYAAAYSKYYDENSGWAVDDLSNTQFAKDATLYARREANKVVPIANQVPEINYDSIGTASTDSGTEYNIFKSEFGEYYFEANGEKVPAFNKGGSWYAGTEDDNVKIVGFWGNEKNITKSNDEE